jgi:hypothetical protein|tara:strand:- start:9318 stop:9590 length:273 start_codon:yes stop_codon:yes gene_type:complete
MENLTQKEIDRLDDIKLLLDNNEFVAWESDMYELRYKSLDNKKILVVCIENGYTTGLCQSDILQCYTDKWTIRENEYPQLKNITTVPDNK